MAPGQITLFFLVTMAFCGACFGATYRVGDSTGWTSRGHVDYSDWASTKDFHVGDMLNFAYNNVFHNVMQVTEQDFESCNPTSPVALYTSGFDTINLETSGNLYFICGSPGHCQAGQRVEIMVNPPDNSVASPSPSPTPHGFGSSPSASNSEAVPAKPALSNAHALHLSKLEFVVTTLVLYFFSFAF